MVIIFQPFTDRGEGWKTGFISERERVHDGEFTTPFLRERKDWLSESTRETERESEGGGRRGGNYLE